MYNENDNKFAAIYHPDSVKIHPKAENGFDIALVALNETIQFNDQIHHVCLPENSVDGNGDDKAEWNTYFIPWDQDKGNIVNK